MIIKKTKECKFIFVDTCFSISMRDGIYLKLKNDNNDASLLNYQKTIEEIDKIDKVL
jgi:hypothetical protein